MSVQLKASEINGPFVTLIGTRDEDDVMLRTFYAAAGKVVVTARDGRRKVSVTVDAADLVQAVLTLIPSAAPVK